MQSNKMKDPPIRAVPMNLFPTMDTVESVIELGVSQLPIIDRNSLVTLFGVYHNTLLKTWKESDYEQQSRIKGQAK